MAKGKPFGGALDTDYPQKWLEFWDNWLGVHSMLRCPGGSCPGGCGAGAKSLLKKLVEADTQKCEKCGSDSYVGSTNIFSCLICRECFLKFKSRTESIRQEGKIRYAEAILKVTPSRDDAKTLAELVDCQANSFRGFLNES